MKQITIMFGTCEWCMADSNTCMLYSVCTVDRKVSGVGQATVLENASVRYLVRFRVRSHAEIVMDKKTDDPLRSFVSPCDFLQ